MVDPVYGPEEKLPDYEWDSMVGKTDCLCNFTFNRDMIIKAIDKTRGNVAPGIDSINGELFKRAVELLWFPLQDLFQSILDTSSMPYVFMVNMVTPLFKGSGQKVTFADGDL